MELIFVKSDEIIIAIGDKSQFFPIKVEKALIFPHDKREKKC